MFSVNGRILLLDDRLLFADDRILSVMIVQFQSRYYQPGSYILAKSYALLPDRGFLLSRIFQFELETWQIILIVLCLLLILVLGYAYHYARNHQARTCPRSGLELRKEYFRIDYQRKKSHLKIVKSAWPDWRRTDS